MLTNERTLLYAAQQGDANATLLLLKAYKPLVLKLAAKQRNLDKREDLQSELTVAFLTAVKEFSGEETYFPAYIKQYLGNVLCNYQRKEQSRARTQQTLLEMAHPEDFIQQDILDEKERDSRLWNICNTLSPVNRRLLFARLHQPPVPWKALSLEFGLTRDTLQKRHRKILLELKSVYNVT